MRRLSVLLPMAAVALAFAARTNGESPVVSNLHTVSIHVDSVATFNALLRLWSEDFQWPLIFGKPLSADRKDRRNYAGIWAGNVRLEICGPYPLEFQPRDSGARLHGLTFRPRETAEKSAIELDRHEIRHKPTVTWGTPDSPLKFVIFDDSGMNAPLFSISIMDVMNRKSEENEHDRAHRTMTANHGGPLGLKHVREIHITYSDAGALRKWQRLLRIDAQWWPGDGGPGLRFIRHTTSGIAAAVLEVRSLEESAQFLRGLGFKAARLPDRVECKINGVRLLLTE
jgi:hypothetical protein